MSKPARSWASAKSLRYVAEIPPLITWTVAPCGGATPIIPISLTGIVSLSPASMCRGSDQLRLIEIRSRGSSGTVRQRTRKRRHSVREIRTHTHTGCDSSVDPRVHVAAEEKRQPEIEEAPAKRSGNVVKNLVAGVGEP